MRRLGIVTALVLVAVTGVVAGCGGSGASHVRILSSSIPTGEDAALVKELLTVADLPTGWAIDNRDSDTNDPKWPFKVPDSAKAIAKADTSFAKGSMPQLQEQLGLYSDGPSSFVAYVDGYDHIKSLDYSSDGEKVSLAFGRMSFPAMGDESAAYSISGSIKGFTIGGAMVVVRTGNKMLALLLFDLGSVDTMQLEEFATDALAKVPAAAQ